MSEGFKSELKNEFSSSLPENFLLGVDKSKKTRETLITSVLKTAHLLKIHFLYEPVKF